MNKVRLYSFRDLMQRLMHRDWAVTPLDEDGTEFVFIPRTYISRRNI